MGKSKPSQIIVHRIEFQETERATIEAALAGRFVTNSAAAAGQVFHGLGNLLTPFAGAISALAALWIADRSIEEIIETVKSGKEAAELLYTSSKTGTSIYEHTVAWLTATYENTGFEYLNSRGRGPADNKTATYFMELHDNLTAEFGPYAAGPLRDMLLFSCYRAKEQTEGRLLETPEGGEIPIRTPTEWFVYEMPLDRWNALMTQFNARN